MKYSVGQIRTAQYLEKWIWRVIRGLGPVVRLMSHWRQKRGRPASLWGTTPILTLSKLAAADRLLGFSSQSLVFTTYYITSAFDYVLKGQINFLERKAPLYLRCYYLLVFLWALLRYDVFHFFFDRGILEGDDRFGVNRHELNWLRRLGKRVYLYAYGGDVRTRKKTMSLGKFNVCMHCDQVNVNCICDDEEGARKQAVYQQYATATIAMGDMMAYVPNARNLNYWPFDVASAPYVGVQWDGRRPLKIVHVPNHAWAKGTHYLQQVIERLGRQGVPFDYVQISKKPNAEILRLIGEADIVADQFIAGWHGYTALEAMALGKIVLCFIREDNMLLAPAECPIISADPDSLADVLTRLAHASPQKLQEQGAAGRAYVERHFSVPAVALRLGKLYLDTGKFSPEVSAMLHARMRAIEKLIPERVPPMTQAA
jgi:hypothetical protein